MKRLERLDSNMRKEIIQENEKMKKEAKRRVTNSLSRGNGVQKGVYKRSIVIRSLGDKQTDLDFQIGGNKKHYRLTHLLEHGHRVKINGAFINKRTKAIPHIRPGQDYVDEAALKLFDQALDRAIEKEK